MIDYVIVISIVLILSAIVINYIRKVKSGESKNSCGCGCSGCSVDSCGNKK